MQNLHERKKEFQIGMKTLDKQYTQKKKKESLKQKNIQIQI